MKRIEQALQYKDVHRAVVFGADGESLSREITQITGRNVHLIDFRNGNFPPLLDRIPEIAEKNEIALIAIDTSPPADFAPLLSDLFIALKGHGFFSRTTALRKLPDFATKTSVVICTTARVLTDIQRFEPPLALREEMMFVLEDGHSSPAGMTQ
jgi:hypothetical protein